MDSFDVAVIGGGPAGATMATYLRQKGYKTVVLEKTRFPRFHVGESLLPENLALFDELGIHDRIKRSGYPTKLGAEFVSQCGDQVRRFYFRERLLPGEEKAYQVLRSDFDCLLLNRAREMGADVRENTTVTEVNRTQRSYDVKVEREGASSQTLRARVLVDASGLNTFLASRLGLKRVHDANRYAIFTHFRDVDRDSGDDAGNIRIIPFGQGYWFWVIPLRDRLTSVGAVVGKEVFGKDRRDFERYFHTVVGNTRALKQRMSNAVQVEPIRAIADFAYESSRFAGEGFVIVGDAAAFLDPVFSSGVLMAMSSAREAAVAIDRAFRRDDFSVHTLRSYEREHRRKVSGVFRLIRAYYRPSFLQMFMNPSDALGLKGAVTTVLAGAPARQFRLRWRLELFYFIGWLRGHLSSKEFASADCSHGCRLHSAEA
jgi:flavin-dependent dehydrogenase